LTSGNREANVIVYDINGFVQSDEKYPPIVNQYSGNVGAYGLDVAYENGS
jgi:hypothetical protein